jgi:hypothetical protein
VSVAEAAHRPTRSGRTLALWIGFLIVIAAGVGLAWVGAGSLRPTVTASGLEFRTIKAGTGQPIGQADAALMDYVLTSDDGTVIDASQSHGEGGPQPFAMFMVYPGFAEAMTRMQEGGQYRFSMPQSLAGSSPLPGFPKGSKLNFEVRVRKIVRGGAALLQQQMQQQMQQGAPQ